MTMWSELMEEHCGEVSCRYDPDMWFDENSTKAASRHCEGCPLALRCLVLGMGERYGVWGGLSAARRSRLRHAALPGLTFDEVRSLARSVALVDGDDVAVLERLPESASSHPSFLRLASL